MCRQPHNVHGHCNKSPDEGEAVNIIYLDFAKAFDKVSHQRLWTKLRAKGVEAKTVKWIESWLSNRTQNVNIQGERSESCDVDSGVPQGTVLGPILFKVYIDDLEVEVISRLLEVLTMKFADNTKGAKVIESVSDRDKLQEALDCFCEWAVLWGGGGGVVFSNISTLENSALAAANFAALRWPKRAVAGGSTVLMWCTALCMAGGSLPSALATSWKSIKICGKAGSVACIPVKRPLLDDNGASIAAGGLLRTFTMSWC
jgi:hypothetical protein